MINQNNTGSLSSVTLAITGASGAPYALTLLKSLLSHPITVYLLISDAAREVFRIESNLIIPDTKEEIEAFFPALLFDDSLFKDKEATLKPQAQLHFFDKKDWLSPAASGSNAADVMVVCPCSMGTLAAIATGASKNLIERAADVTIKENKRLLIVPREMPVSIIHLENMLKLRQMGVTILPASPGFYQNPKTIQDLVDFVVARILDQIGLKQELLPRWGDS